MKSPRERKYSYYRQKPEGDPDTLWLPIEQLDLDPLIKKRLIRHPGFKTLGDLVSFSPQYYIVFVRGIGNGSMTLIEAALEEFNLILPAD